MSGRDSRIAEVDGARPPARALPERADDRYAAMAGGDGEVGRLALELSARIRGDAPKRRSEQRRLKSPEVIIVQPLLLERQPERFGEREHLVVVTPVRPEKRPDAEFLLCLVVHGHGGH